jgi:microcystin-dependent protein
MIIIVPYNFSPRGWAFCNGQILPIAQNTALFSLLGTTFGGNGQTTFALPDLRGRVSNSSGQGPGLSNYDLGQVGGTESETITVNQMPAHNHQAACLASGSDSGRPNGKFLSNINVPSDGAATLYASTSDNLMAPTMITNTGGSQPISLLQPYLTLNYCIALEGIFPSRN